VPPQGDCENLFMSEITFGKSQNGNFWDLNYAVEIHNPTGNSINLSSYELLLTDLTLSTLSIPLSGILASGDVYVVSNDNADLNLQNLADQLASGMDFSLYACLELRQSNVVLDKIGQKFNNNPNSSFDPVQFVQDPYGYMLNYDINLDDYENITLRRSYFDLQGDPIFSPAVSAMLGHWSYHPNTDISDIGTHGCDCYSTEATDILIGYFLGSNGLIFDLNNPTQAHLLKIFFANNGLPTNYSNYVVNTQYRVDTPLSTAWNSVGWNSIHGMQSVARFATLPFEAFDSCTLVRPNYFTTVMNCTDITYNDNVNVTPPNELVVVNLTATNPDTNYPVVVDPARMKAYVYFNKWPTAVNSFEIENIKVYPTAFYDNIVINSKKEEMSYSILTSNGQILRSGSIMRGENVLTLGDLSKGMYIVRLLTKNGSHSVKILKQ